jgi:hypothetical protein
LILINPSYGICVSLNLSNTLFDQINFFQGLWI